ncbi:hypothetical protein [Hyphomicrobium sp.]|uniref:helix-turn-helix transcriptional regulator n=1 Tax=Hyphomicrobium sp. TaxID=82 RepID=UPI002D793ED1|nr:hypothetical protein [Hyphomicrobium sp.]HET6388571.1 hypothetical protein [Hyphomicrobium sp.]
MGIPSAYVNQRRAAELLGVTTRTLRNWKSADFGPRPVRDGPSLLYRRDEIDDFRMGVAR